MDQSNVIIPNRPGVMISKGWMIKRKTGQKSSEGSLAQDVKPAAPKQSSFSIIFHKDSSSRSDRSSRGRKSRPAARKESRRAPQSPQTPLRNFGAGSETPFGAYPTVMKPQYHNLLQYYLTVNANDMYPYESHLTYNPVKRTWFQLAMTDEVLFHTIIFAAAAHMSLFNRSNSSYTDIERLMTPALSLLSQRLVDSDAQLSDTTISAVSCLAITEGLRGNTESRDVHVKGLERMIRLRGGLEVLDDDLQTKVFRSAIDAAVDGLTLPRLPLFKRSQPTLYSTVFPLSTLFASRLAVGTPPFFSVFESLALDSSLSAVISDLIQFSTALDYVLASPNAIFHPRAFDEDILLVQWHLLSIVTFLPPLASAVRIAALIFTRAIKFTVPEKGMACPILVAHLKSALASLVEGPDAPIRPDSDFATASALLWILFMGSIASSGTNERIWFTANLLRFTNMVSRLSENDDTETWWRGSPNWDVVRSVLTKTIWVEAILTEPCRCVWEEVEVIRSVLKE